MKRNRNNVGATLGVVLKSLSLILSFFICLTGTAKAIEWAELNPLGRVDWATWDPIGKTIFRPLEEIFPKLKLRGFIENETDVLLHRRPFDDLNLPKVSYNLPKIQWLFELEAHYHFTEYVELGLITHMLYDAAFDWDQLYKKNFKSTRNFDDSLEYFHDYDRILRELYLNISRPSWNLRIGKQQVVWGKVDGAKIMDVVNPEDFREFAEAGGEGDWEFSRLPTWMLNFHYFWGDYNFQFLLIPDFERNLMERLAPFMFPNSFNERLAPPPFIRLAQVADSRPHDFSTEALEFGFRMGVLKRGWDVHLSYFYTTTDYPIFFKRATIPSFPGPFGPLGPPFLTIVLEPKHTKIHQFGGNFEKSVYFGLFDEEIVFRGEVLYNMNDYFEAMDESQIPKDGAKKKDWLKSGVAIEGTLGTDWFTALRFDNNVIFNYDGDLRTFRMGKKLEHWQQGLTFSIIKQFYHDRANLETWTAYILDDGDWWWHGVVTYEFTDRLIGKIGIDAYSGNSDDLFGQFEKRGNITLGLSYSF